MPDALVVHVAGPEIEVKGDSHWLRQRCSWCGACIVDVDLTRVALEVVEGEEDTPVVDRVPTWEVGALVAHDGNVWYVVNMEDEGKMPPEACMMTDPEVTT